jgi:hypothetical protein
MEKGTERRAYLWIPPRCSHVRGVAIGLQNMLERSIFEDSTIRAAIDASNMAIVWISPGAWPGKLAVAAQPDLAFSPPADAVEGVQHVLAALARESGYSEIEFAPLLVVGHSAASPFVWGMARALPKRVFAAFVYKGSAIEGAPFDVPFLQVAQEWAEWGPKWGEVWRREFDTVAALRASEAPRLGVFADIGSGHFDWHHPSAEVLAMFIRKAAEYRLPANGPLQGPVELKPLSSDMGVLVDSASFGTSRFQAVPVGKWRGDSKKAFWYFDGEMAEAVQHFMQEGLDKKPEAIDFVVDGKHAPLLENGFAVIHPAMLSDGVTFRVHAEGLDASPTANLYGGASLGHSSAPIQYWVSSGALLQTGLDTFQVVARSGSMARQGMPWEPWIMAYRPGDREYRSADKPAHILIDIRNAQGLPQQIAFPEIPDVDRSASGHITLYATSSSGLPVQFYVESGPVSIEGNTLRILPIPPRSHYPVRVIVSAFQWGRQGEHPVQSAGPETREFFIRR